MTVLDDWNLTINFLSGADPGEVKWGNFHPPPLSLSPLLSFSFYLIPGFGSITLLQKFTPHFKILDPRLGLPFHQGAFSVPRIFGVASSDKH